MKRIHTALALALGLAAAGPRWRGMTTTTATARARYDYARVVDVDPIVSARAVRSVAMLRIGASGALRAALHDLSPRHHRGDRAGRPDRRRPGQPGRQGRRAQGGTSPVPSSVVRSATTARRRNGYGYYESDGGYCHAATRSAAAPKHAGAAGAGGGLQREPIAARRTYRTQLDQYDPGERLRVRVDSEVTPAE